MELFVVTAPGLEPFLATELRELGMSVREMSPGGVTLDGDWHTVQMINRRARGATRVLARLTSFRAMHLAQLDKRARKLPWVEWLRPDVPVRVDAVCRKSRIYHHKGAAQRISGAVSDALGVTIAADAPLVLKVRIEDDLCTISVDTSGASLHLRGIKQQVNKAPMRETLASLFLRACGYDGREPLYDPMCGSGTFPIEAAEIARGLVPGRARNFAFEQLASFDGTKIESPEATRRVAPIFFGSDRDQGAIKMASANAERAGVSDVTAFEQQSISDIAPPCPAPGLVIVNPPYGGRIGNKKPLFGLYGSFGQVMKTRFQGWRIGMITSDAGLAKATALPWNAPGPIVDHGGTKIRLWQTDPIS